MPLIEDRSQTNIREVLWLAPAKVNLYLRILGKRPDGYHNLESLMVPLKWGDRLRVRLEGESKKVKEPISLVVRNTGLAGDATNLAYKAARLFCDSLKKEAPPITMELEKEIPLGAGLGGGSSDAAAVLLALNHLLHHPLSRQDLLSLGSQLGADVPFFILQQAALAKGTGTELTPVKLPEKIWLVLINPGFQVSTAWVYENFRSEWTSSLTSDPVNEKLSPLVENRSGEVATVKISDWKRFLHNDLERVTLGAYPELCTIKDTLLSAGARGALMSGSGPTVFGVYPGTEGEGWARKLAAQFAEEKKWRVFAAESL